MDDRRGCCDRGGCPTSARTIRAVNHDRDRELLVAGLLMLAIMVVSIGVVAVLLFWG